MNIASDIQRLLGALRQAEAGASPTRAALATIVRTHGSTYRKPGASMLVLETGEVVCALAGGCPQRDIVERARAVIADSRARIASYNRESGLDVLIEMGCGGELEVLIESLAQTRDAQFLFALGECQERRVEAW